MAVADNVMNVTPPKVTVSLGYTRNMGNFESLRVDLGVEDSVRAGDGVGKVGIDKAMQRVYTYVEEQLLEKVREVEEEVKKVAKK